MHCFHYNVWLFLRRKREWGKQSTVVLIFDRSNRIDGHLHSIHLVLLLFDISLINYCDSKWDLFVCLFVRLFIHLFIFNLWNYDYDHYIILLIISGDYHY